MCTFAYIMVTANAALQYVAMLVLLFVLKLHSPVASAPCVVFNFTVVVASGAVTAVLFYTLILFYIVEAELITE